jgi:periplasmic protein TonB
MSARNARRLLIAAFAISLALHVLLALNLRPRPNETPAEVETVRIEKRSMVIHVAKTPPPPPRPKHTPAPSTSPAPKATAKGLKPAGNAGAGPTAAPTAAPTPAATAVANACGKNDADAAVVVEPTPPVIPVSARADGTSGTAVIKVDLDATGAVTGATVAQTSGSQALDTIAIGMARDAQYSPALHDCKPVATAYEFSVRFAAW